MIVLALLLAASPQTASTSSLDWEALPALPYRAPPILTQPMSDFVAREVRTRKCQHGRTVSGRDAVKVDVAVLVDADQGVRATVPRAIDCPTVEQYAAGLVSSFARNNLLPRPATTDEIWYRTSVTFAWDR
jgi:hypothetical protein